MLKITVVVFCILGLMLVLAKVPLLSIIVFGFGSYGAIMVWAYIDLRRESLTRLRSVEDALQQNEAHVVHIQSDAMVQVEEIDDEGACYAFQVDDNRIILVTGQDFYPSKKFPSNDFSLIDICDSRGRLVDMFVDKRGTKLEPIRKISGERKRTLRILQHQEIISGNLSELENLLTE